MLGYQARKKVNRIHLNRSLSENPYGADVVKEVHDRLGPFKFTDLNDGVAVEARGEATLPNGSTYVG